MSFFGSLFHELATIKCNSSNIVFIEQLMVTINWNHVLKDVGGSVLWTRILVQCNYWSLVEVGNWQVPISRVGLQDLRSS